MKKLRLTLSTALNNAKTFSKSATNWARCAALETAAWMSLGAAGNCPGLPCPLRPSAECGEATASVAPGGSTGTSLATNTATSDLRRRPMVARTRSKAASSMAPRIDLITSMPNALAIDSHIDFQVDSHLDSRINPQVDPPRDPLIDLRSDAQVDPHFHAQVDPLIDPQSCPATDPSEPHRSYRPPVGVEKG